MTATLDAFAIPSPAQLAVAMRCGADGGVEIIRLELRTDELSIVIADRGRTPLKDQLDPRFSELLTTLVDRHRETSGLTTLPETSERIGELCLIGCRVLVTRSYGGAQNLLVRFSYLVGDLGALFAAGPFARPARPPSVARLVELTSNVLMPLRDFYAHLEALGGRLSPAELARHGRRFLDRVYRDKLRECEIYHYLLVRHLESAERDSSSACSALSGSRTAPSCAEAAPSAVPSAVRAAPPL